MLYENIIKSMLKRNQSIREVAKELGVSRSKLHRELTKAKINLDNETLVNFNKLLEKNKNKGRKKKEV